MFNPWVMLLIPLAIAIHHYYSIPPEKPGEPNLEKYLGPMSNMFILVTCMIVGFIIGTFFNLWDAIGSALGLY